MSLTHTPCNHSHLSYTYPSHCVSYTALLLHFSYPNYTYPNHITSHIFQLIQVTLSLIHFTMYPNHKHWYAHTHTHILIISCLNKHIPHATTHISHAHTHLTACVSYTIMYCLIFLHFSCPNHAYPNHITSQYPCHFISHIHTLITSQYHAHIPVTSTGMHTHTHPNHFMS